VEGDTPREGGEVEVTAGGGDGRRGNGREKGRSQERKKPSSKGNGCNHCGSNTHSTGCTHLENFKGHRFLNPDDNIKYKASEQGKALSNLKPSLTYMTKARFAMTDNDLKKEGK
jgi:hypothetical protein